MDIASPPSRLVRICRDGAPARSSVGLRLTAACAFFVDPYLNVDAGTMSPFEHGEVFVLDDGGEVRTRRLSISPGAMYASLSRVSRILDDRLLC